ncbi:hypothetical protein ABZ990_31070, partial [Streptomyces sp. NPDC046203]|uniref:hypothetical protein n=1 Tax=Streptomyces sp. NPDC046203 TaxID=3154602 RepID=UPI0033BFF5CF
MLCVHFTAEDLSRVRFAPRPAPLQELHAALTTAVAPGRDPLFGRWRGRVLRALPATAGPLADLVPAGRPPAFLDILSDTLDESFELIRTARPETVRTELERVYGAGVPPRWVRGLHAGEEASWRVVRRAQRAAYEAVLAPVWPLVRDLHREEFARHALTVAEHGLGAALTALAPGSAFDGSVWRWPAPPEATTLTPQGSRGTLAQPSGGPASGRTVRLDGRGLVLVPTFHHPAGPLLQDLPARPVVLTYPAGSGHPPAPLAPDGPDDPDDPLAPVLGRTRAELLRLLAEPRSTTELARALRVSNATASGHEDEAGGRAGREAGRPEREGRRREGRAVTSGIG